MPDQRGPSIVVRILLHARSQAHSCPQKVENTCVQTNIQCIILFFCSSCELKKKETHVRPRVYLMPKKEYLVVFNVLTLHILTYEGSWTGSWMDIPDPPSWEKKHEFSPSIYHCKHNSVILNNIIISIESICDNYARHTPRRHML